MILTAALAAVRWILEPMSALGIRFKPSAFVWHTHMHGLLDLLKRLRKMFRGELPEARKDVERAHCRQGCCEVKNLAKVHAEIAIDSATHAADSGPTAWSPGQ